MTINLILSKNHWRTILYLSFILLVLYIASHLFYLSLFNYFSIDKIDTQIKHELEHVLQSVSFEGDSLIFKNITEFDEDEFNSKGDDAFYFQIYDESRNIIFRSKNVVYNYPIPLIYSTSEAKFVYADIELENEDLRSIITKFKKGDKTYYLQLSAVNSVFDEVIKKIFIFDLITLPFILILMVVIGILFVNKSYDPIKKIINHANEISALSLNERIPSDSVTDDVINRLIKTLNNLFERLDQQVKEISNFSDNASHQLMTPLTAIQTELEFILKRDRDIEQYQETLMMMSDQSRRMINIVKSLLLMTHPERIVQSISKIVNLYPLFENEIIPIHRHYEQIEYKLDKNLYVRGQIEYFSIIINNLIDNAIKYSPESSPIIFSARKIDNRLTLKCEDFGIGIKKEDKDRIFERFYRSENTERKGIKGYGLGLSLVKSLVESLNGEIEINTEREKGTEFIVKFNIIKFE